MSTAPASKGAAVKAADVRIDPKVAAKTAAAKTVAAPAPSAGLTAEQRKARNAAKRAAKAQAVAARRPAHSDSRLAQVLIAPIVSEKATMAAEKHNQVLFQVVRDATKPEIKAAVELMFKVSVDSVQTVQHKGKAKRTAKSNGRRNHVKKAYVCLAAGQELNFSGEGA